MFNRDGLFGKKDERGRSEPRAANVTPPGAGSTGVRAPAPPDAPRAETPRPDLRFAEPPKPQPRAEEPSPSRLIVGPDIKLKGVEITDCDTLVVEGRVEASMDSRVVQISETGVFKGCVSIDVAEIRGRFEGELTARKQLVIHATGRVSGNIRYGKLRIEEGGEVSGQISTLAEPHAPAQTPAQPAQQSVPRPAQGAGAPAQSTLAELEGSAAEPAARGSGEPAPRSQSRHSGKASVTTS
jgi:cytoskeletal protein CcmA (bactofilin family)